MMKKLTKAALLAGFVACPDDDDNIAVTGVALANTTVSMQS